MFYENPGGIYNINYVRIRDGANGYFKLPSLTTTQRDALSPVANGYMIYNSTTSQVEAYEGGSWSGTAGDVSGPGSSTGNAVARFDGTGGKLLQNSVVTIADTTGNMTGVGTLTLGDVLTFSDGATIDNTDANTLTITETNVVIAGNLDVTGTTTTINSTTLQVDDKNIELGTVAVPDDTTADGGGITLKGSTDKTIIWDNANDNWTFNQSVNIATGLDFKVNNVSVLNATTLGSAVVSSSLTSVGTISSGVWQGTVIDHERGGLEADVSAYSGFVYITGGATSARASGISDTNVVVIHGADIASGEFARFTASGLESRTAAEVLSDMTITATSIGISDAGNYFTGTDVEVALQEVGEETAYADSPGIITGGAISEGTTGTFTVAVLTAYLRATHSRTGALVKVSLAEQANQAITSADTPYMIMLDYNGGSPQIVLSETNLYEAGTDYTQIPIGKVMKDSSDNVHFISGGFNFQDGVEKLHIRAKTLRGLELGSGSAIAYSGTNNFTMAAAVIYRGLNKFTESPYDSDVTTFTPLYTGFVEGNALSGTDIAFVDGGGGEDTITRVAADFVDNGYVAGDILTVSGSASNDGDYTIVSVVAGTINIATGSLTGEIAGETVTLTVEKKKIDFAHYDNAGTLAEIGNAKYGCHWVYRHADDGHVFVRYGTGSYSLAAAEAALEPTKPDRLTNFGLLIGCIIAPQAGGSFTTIQMVSDTFFSGTSVADHGSLSGLADDDHPQYVKDSEFSGDSYVLVGTGAGTFAAETGATLRTSLGLGTADSVQFAGLTTTTIQANGAITVGVDETGHDVKFFGATTGAYLLFDESEDALVLQGGATKQMEIRFMEDTDNGAHYAALKASASMAAAITWILPAADSTGTQYLRSDGSGNLSFATIAGGGDVLADGSVPFTASVFIQEIAAAAADVPGSGQVWVKNDAPCTLWFTDDDGADTEITSAIHDNVAGEIVAIAEKTAPISADEFLIEDSADSNNKKSLKFSNTPLSILKNTVTTKTGTATLTIAEAGVVLVSAAGAYTLTLPTASGNAGLTYRFIKTDANYNLITLDGNGAETFNFENSTEAPVATYTRLNTYCAEVTVVSDGTNWQCIDEQTGLMPSMLAYINANQNDLTHQTNVTVELNTEVYDIGSNFNTGTYTFTAPIAGKYLVMAKVAFVAASVVAGEHASLIIGSVAGYLAYAWTQIPTAGKDGACVASNVVSLAANETVTLAAHIGHPSADTMDIYGNAQGDTYLSILMLSKN